jgi:hypothetical protein
MSIDSNKKIRYIKISSFYANQSSHETTMRQKKRVVFSFFPNGGGFTVREQRRGNNPFLSPRGEPTLKSRVQIYASEGMRLFLFSLPLFFLYLRFVRETSFSSLCFLKAGQS